MTHNLLSTNVSLRTYALCFVFYMECLPQNDLIISYITNIINIGFMTSTRDYVNNMLITLLITSFINM